ncbi:MAG TPA: Na+/H+ antiporter [Polyangiales bacterium]|nr:Na+/H+ antiporter [Polyangiales bacterium]
MHSRRLASYGTRLPAGTLMVIFEITIALLLVGAVLALWADRIGVPYPALLAFAGAGVALIPGVPDVQLDPELALVLFVAPTLLDAAYDASPRDLRANIVPVVMLALVAVGLTIAVVAWVARMSIPSLGWAAAITLGATVAPPDASAATAVLRRLRPPHRIMVILEGESLFNDASALLVYRIAMGAAMTGAFSGWAIVPTLLLTCGGGAVLGLVLAKLSMPLANRITDIPTSVLTQFLSTFGVWLIADRLHVSAIITLVTYAMTIARVSPGTTSARRRIASYAVWDVAVFVLNALAFVLIGLQLRGILQRLANTDFRVYVWAAVAVCFAVIGVRLLFWMSFNKLVRWRIARGVSQDPGSGMKPTLGSGLVIAWCGMRGIVTLAAALALPDGPNGFPHRDFIVFAAFCVVLSTLVLQGATLRPLIRVLGLRDDGSVERELQVARAETARAALSDLERHAEAEPPPAVALLRREYSARLRAIEVEVVRDVRDGDSLAQMQRQAVTVQRRALLELRARSVIGDDAFHVIEEEIDMLELSADGRVHPDI